MYDSRHSRLSVFDDDGQFVRSIPIRPTEDVPFPRVVGVLSVGSILIYGGLNPPDFSGAQRFEFQLWRYDASADSMADVESVEFHRLVKGS